MKKKIDFSFLQEYLTFNKREQRGLWVLALLIFLVIASNGVLPLLYQDKQVDFSEFEAEIQAFESSLANTRTKLKITPKVDSFPKKEVIKIVKPVVSEPQKEKKPVIIHLNSCDSAQLVQLRGIGPVFASRILKYRTILGGYYCKDQLIEVYGMDSERLQPILSSIKVDTNLITKMDINTIEFKKLLKHPYFEYEIVKAIFNHKRSENGFSDISQLRNVEGLDEEMYLKMRPYVVVNSKYQYPNPK